MIIPGLLLRGVSRTTALQRPHVAVSPDLNERLQSAETSLKGTWGSTANVFCRCSTYLCEVVQTVPRFLLTISEMKRYNLSHPCSGQFVPCHPSRHLKSNQSYQFWFIYLICCFWTPCFVGFTLAFVNCTFSPDFSAFLLLPYFYLAEVNLIWALFLNMHTYCWLIPVLSHGCSIPHTWKCFLCVFIQPTFSRFCFDSPDRVT